MNENEMDQELAREERLSRIAVEVLDVLIEKFPTYLSMEEEELETANEFGDEYISTNYWDLSEDDVTGVNELIGIEIERREMDPEYMKVRECGSSWDGQHTWILKTTPSGSKFLQCSKCGVCK